MRKYSFWQGASSHCYTDQHTLQIYHRKHFCTSHLQKYIRRLKPGPKSSSLYIQQGCQTHRSRGKFQIQSITQNTCLTNLKEKMGKYTHQKMHVSTFRLHLKHFWRQGVFLSPPLVLRN